MTVTVMQVRASVWELTGDRAIPLLTDIEQRGRGRSIAESARWELDRLSRRS